MIGILNRRLFGGQFGVTVRTVLQHVIRTPKLIVSTISCNVFAGLMEAGTFGLVVLAVDVLVEGRTNVRLSALFSKVENVFPLLLELSSGAVFIVLILCAISLQIFKSGLEYLGAFCAIRLTKNASDNLQEIVTQKILSLDYADVARYPAGVLAAIISQADVVAQKLIVRIFNNGILSIILFIVYTSLLVTISFSLTVIAIMVVIVFLVLMGRVSKTLKILGKKNTEGLLEHGKVVVDYLNATRLIKTFQREKFVEEEVGLARRQVLDASAKSGVIEAAIGPGTQVLTILGIGAFLLIGYFTSGESATLFAPKAIVFMIIIQRLMHPVRTLNDCRMTLANNFESLHKIGELLSMVTSEQIVEDRRALPKFQNKIEFRQVGFRYPESNRNAVTNVTFSIAKGETVAVVGGSGAGKSTIANLLLGLYSPTKGGIFVDGIDLQQIDKGDWFSKIGVVDQNVLLLNTSVGNNIAFGSGKLKLNDVESAARLAQAHGFISKMERKYDTVVGDRGYRLSGGEQQRIALARAIYRKPDILLLDEATSSLDTESEELIKSSILELGGSHTLLVIAHRFSTISNADRIVVIEEGQIRETGTKDQLLAANGTFARLWATQFST